MGERNAVTDKRLIENVTPILRVASLNASLDYYENVLGFKAGWSTSDFAGIWRDGFDIYLSEGGQGQPGTWLWLGVTDLDAIYNEIVAKGAKIVMERTEFEWAREFRVEDPDGHVLRFGGSPSGEQ